MISSSNEILLLVLMIMMSGYFVDMGESRVKLEIEAQLQCTIRKKLKTDDYFLVTVPFHLPVLHCPFQILSQGHTSRVTLSAISFSCLAMFSNSLPLLPATRPRSY